MALWIRTSEFLRLVTGHPQMADNSKQFMTRVGKDPECWSQLWQDSVLFFGSGAKNCEKAEPDPESFFIFGSSRSLHGFQMYNFLS